MTNFSRALRVGLLAAGMYFACSTVHAEGRPALQVVVIETNENTPVYLEGLKSVFARFRELTPEVKLRAFVSRFSGTDTRRVYVFFEYPNLAALAAAFTKLDADAELARRIDAVRKSTDRRTLSDSILLEVTP